MDLSVIIPARNEMFLKQTVDNVLKNIRGDSEVIACMDGYWSEPINDHDRLTILHYGKSIGQRAITNQGAKLSRAKYIMKLDAHCSVDEGFDVKMMEKMEPDITMIPIMYNLWAFDWKCMKCGKRTYQGITPTKCSDCDNTTDFKRKILWKEKRNPTSTSYRFDKDLHFQYWKDYRKKQDAMGTDLVPTLSAQGSCFMLTRERYFDLNICDEAHGSWGQQGTEVAMKSWLSGGRLLVNLNTWYAHMFRTKGGDFGFPYSLTNAEVKRAREYSKDLWLNDKWDKAVMTLDELLEKFRPVPEWHE